MSYHIRRGACATTNKRCWLTRAEAKKSVRNYHVQDVTVYKCGHCTYFHVGGWHGSKDRAAHRGETTPDTMTIADACRLLNVTPGFITRLINTDRVQTFRGNPYRTDIERIAKL